VKEITEYAYKGPQCTHQETSDLDEQDIVARCSRRAAERVCGGCLTELGRACGAAC
jgi:hypothetical protein